jgi:acyl-CoA dehydrogenase
VVPADQLGHEVAKLLIEPSATRDRLTGGMYLSKDNDDAIRIIELALEATVAAEPIEARMRDAQKAGRISVKPGEDRAAAAHAANVITADELALVRKSRRLVDEVIRVDDFPQDLGLSEMRPPASMPSLGGTVARKAAA